MKSFIRIVVPVILAAGITCITALAETLAADTTASAGIETRRIVADAYPSTRVGSGKQAGPNAVAAPGARSSGRRDVSPKSAHGIAIAARPHGRVPHHRLIAGRAHRPRVVAQLSAVAFLSPAPPVSAFFFIHGVAY